MCIDEETTLYHFKQHKKILKYVNAPTRTSLQYFVLEFYAT